MKIMYLVFLQLELLHLCVINEPDVKMISTIENTNSCQIFTVYPTGLNCSVDDASLHNGKYIKNLTNKTLKVNI